MNSRRKALVTGGTRGIGVATALALRDEGYEVFVTGTSPLGQPPKGCHHITCDFLDRKATEEFAKKIAEMQFSVLVNNAGINKIGLLEDYAVEDFNRLQQVNVIAPFLLCRAVIPGMREQKFGRIVNITSVFGVVSKAGRAAYSTSKFGLLGLSKALALEVAGDNILVNCLAPGFVDTDMSRQILGEKGIQEIIKKIPMERMAQPEEMAQVVKFLVSEKNSYMTGQNIVVDGGFTCE